MTEFERRREEILRIAQCEALSRKRRRFAGQAIAAMIVLGLVATIAMLQSRPRETVVLQKSEPLPQQPKPTARVQWIATDPTITDRLSAKVKSPRWEIVNDNELLETLADAGHPAGIIHFDGQTILMQR